LKVPAIRDGDDAGTIMCEFKEHGHGEVEVRSGRVAPAAIVAGESVVRRAEVCGGDEDGRVTREAPFWVVSAFNFETRATTEPIVEQSSA